MSEETGKTRNAAESSEGEKGHSTLYIVGAIVAAVVVAVLMPMLPGQALALAGLHVGARSSSGCCR